METPPWLRQALQSLSVAIAVADAESLAVVFENAQFFRWFPPAGGADAPLGARLAGFDVERARVRLERGRPFAFESEARVGACTIPLAIEVRPLGESGELLIVECRDVGKQREAEYMLDSYAKMSERHARDLQKEKDRVEKLLLNVMPRTVYEEMKSFGTATPQRFDSASVLMLDFVGFTDMAVSRDPSALIAELNDIFSAFDRIVELFGCERIKTIGDGYMAVSGLPESTPDHAQNAAKVALRMRRYLERRNAANAEPWRCRIGIGTGPLIGSVVGIQKYVYDVFGPAVNLAARLEALCEPMTISVGEETHHAIASDFVLRDRGEVEVKGFGLRRIWFLEGELAGRG
jgi:adenylate cyclase